MIQRRHRLWKNVVSSMLNLKQEILDVIRQDETRIRPYLDQAAMRTHAFLGTSRRIPEVQRRFSRYGDNYSLPCILTQVHHRCYPDWNEVRPVPTISELHPFFECYGIDCTFFARPRTAGPYGFPVVWENDWMIEVENNCNEFAYHLRVLLDITCNHRLGIFFVESPESTMTRLASEFIEPWKSFAATRSESCDPNLQVILFPTTYESWDDYSMQSRTYTWNVRAQQFDVC